jgi:HAD superfamily hydrolase (TIGR01549 family)
MNIAERERLASLVSDDARLGQALDLLAREPISVLSLDVFDTLVWRLVPEPVDAFLLLGHRLKTGGHLAANVAPALFARLRERAETLARESVLPTAAAGEVSLEAIYGQMSPRLFHGSGVDGPGVDELVAIEVELEREITFPDLEVLRLAELAREEFGARVVLVSDTYFSEQQLRHILDREPFESLGVSAVFVSSEHGANKGSGLFRVVLEALGVEPREVLHVGDHPESDVARPAEQRIHTVHFPKASDELKEVLQREGVVRSGPGRLPTATLDPASGDYGLTALRAKAASRAEGARYPPDVRPYFELGAAVLGPMFTGFAEWAHRRAGQEGVDVVHCLMREGEFLARLLNGARDYLGSPVRAERLWLSRQFVTRAAIFRADEEELSGFLKRRRPLTLNQFCEGVGISLADLGELGDDGTGRLDDAGLWQRVLESIARRPDVRRAIVDNSAEVRRRLTAYVTATVGAETERVVLADVGWGATIQAYFDRALAGAGMEISTTGVYLLTNETVVDRMLAGVSADGYLAAGGLPEQVVRSIVRSPETLEQVCMTDVGTLLDFSPDGEPVTAPVNQSPVQMIQRSAVQRGILAFQAEWAKYRSVVPLGDKELGDAARPLLLKGLSRFIVSPTKAEATMFGSWSHDDNYGSKDAEQVISHELGPLLGHMAPDHFLALATTKVYWPFGLAALHHPQLGRAVSALLDGAVPAEALLPAEQEDVFISVDSMKQPPPLPRLVSRRVEATLSRAVSWMPGGTGVVRGVVRPHAGGLCFLDSQIARPSIRHVRVDFPPGPGVIRLDHLSLTFALRGRPDPIRVDIEWPGQSHEVAYARCGVLSDNVLFGSRQAPRVIYACPRSWGADVYRVEVQLAFAWLPTAAIRTNASRTLRAAELARSARSRWLRAEQ